MLQHPAKWTVNIHQSLWSVMCNSHAKFFVKAFSQTELLWDWFRFALLANNQSAREKHCALLWYSIIGFILIPYKLQALNASELKFRFFIFFTINNFQVAYWWTIGRWNGCQPQGPGNHGTTDRYQYLPTAQTRNWFVSSFIPSSGKAVTSYRGHKYLLTTCCDGRF